MRCFECHSQMVGRTVRRYEIARCGRCRSVVMQDVAFVGVLSGATGGAEALLIATELEVVGRGEAAGECPECPSGTLTTALLRGVTVGYCATCRTVAVPRGGFASLRRGARRKNVVETLSVLGELVADYARGWLGSLLWRW